MNVVDAMLNEQIFSEVVHIHVNPSVTRPMVPVRIVLDSETVTRYVEAGDPASLDIARRRITAVDWVQLQSPDPVVAERGRAAIVAVAVDAVRELAFPWRFLRGVGELRQVDDPLAYWGVIQGVKKKRWWRR